MLQSLICCFKPKNTRLQHVVNLTTENKDSSLWITEENSVVQKCRKLDIKPEYNSTEWLNETCQIELKDTIKFVCPIQKGIVIKVYDGDTITIASKLPYLESPLYRFSVRLNGIDCPEMKGKDANEKLCAEIAKQEVSELIMNKIVTLKNVDTEKYGRILADVYLGDLHLNKYLLEKRLAVKYDGGTKISPSNWMNYYRNGQL